MKGWHAENEHPMAGKHHTDEAKAKISNASKELWENDRSSQLEAVRRGAATRKMKQMPPEREQAIIQAYLSGKIISEIEAELNTGRSSIYRILDRNNISRERDLSIICKGKKHSEESKKKMSEARKEYWDDKHSSVDINK
jgi:hypothetical protein